MIRDCNYCKITFFAKLFYFALDEKITENSFLRAVLEIVLFKEINNYLVEGCTSVRNKVLIIDLTFYGNLHRSKNLN